MEDVLAAGAEAGGAVRHEPFALGCADLAAEVGLVGAAELAFFALGGAVCVSACVLRMVCVSLSRETRNGVVLMGGKRTTGPRRGRPP